MDLLKENAELKKRVAELEGQAQEQPVKHTVTISLKNADELNSIITALNKDLTRLKAFKPIIKASK